LSRGAEAAEVVVSARDVGASATIGMVRCHRTMRAALWLVIGAGCWNAPSRSGSAHAPGTEPAAPSPSPSPEAEPCDAPRWRRFAATTRRAWLVSLDEPRRHRAGGPPRSAWHPREPVAVLALDGGDIYVATLREGVIAARWVAASGLGRAAIAETAVSPAPGAPPDPAVRIRPGYRLPADDQPWLSVKHAPAELDGLELEGFVPAAVRGVTWDEPLQPPWRPTRSVEHIGPLLETPQPGARTRATSGREAALEIRGVHAGYWELRARTPRAEVDGFAPRPPPRIPSGPRGRYEFSEDTIEGELVLPTSPLPPGTCLYDAPGGEIAGMILGRQPALLRPVTRAPGWSWLELGMVWGTVTYYVPTPR
jgi:hypothetical protein